ncbi:hypothetical protein EVAR_81938_1 [Eumeta japonica]|uniref:Uncharacterized protein n=1 Tax=Eumeta variegata TaxID=151549 RepID=A0A4C1ZFS7_EUMVA|nr:hypothetical protein EVAR_81938_1 [Eumeta japonica]
MPPNVQNRKKILRHLLPEWDEPGSYIHTSSILLSIPLALLILTAVRYPASGTPNPVIGRGRRVLEKILRTITVQFAWKIRNWNNQEQGCAREMHTGSARSVSGSYDTIYTINRNYFKRAELQAKAERMVAFPSDRHPRPLRWTADCSLTQQLARLHSPAARPEPTNIGY